MSWVLCCAVHRCTFITLCDMHEPSFFCSCWNTHVRRNVADSCILQLLLLLLPLLILLFAVRQRTNVSLGITKKQLKHAHLPLCVGGLWFGGQWRHVQKTYVAPDDASMSSAREKLCHRQSAKVDGFKFHLGRFSVMLVYHSKFIFSVIHVRGCVCVLVCDGVYVCVCLCDDV